MLREHKVVSICKHLLYPVPEDLPRLSDGYI